MHISLRCFQIIEIVFFLLEITSFVDQCYRTSVGLPEGGHLLLLIQKGEKKVNHFMPNFIRWRFSLLRIQANLGYVVVW